MKPLISFLVPTYGRAEHLEKLIKSIQASTPHDVYEIVIVSSDNPSSDKISWLQRQQNANVILTDHRRPWQLRRKSNYHYLNLGIRKTKGEWIFMLNDDMHLASNWYGEFQKVTQQQENSKAGLIIVASHIGTVSHGMRVVIVGRTKKGNEPWKDLYLSDLPLVRKQTMIDVGLFDEHMDWFGSGADLSLAIEFLTDWCIVIAKNIEVHHAIIKEDRQNNITSDFFDFHYLLCKWHRWCAKHNALFEIYDLKLPPYTIKNRIKKYLQYRKKIVLHYLNQLTERMR